jgi:hypothetical protein
MVEAGADMFDNLGRQDTPAEREAFGEFELVNFVDSIQVRLFDKGVGVLRKKSGDLSAEIVEMFLCAQ